MSEPWKTQLRKKKTLHKLKKLKEIAQEISNTMTLTTADIKTLMVLIEHCQKRAKQKHGYDRYNQSAVQHSGHIFDIS